MFNDKWVDIKVDIMEFNHFFERVYDSDFLPYHANHLKEVALKKHL
jgi:hypothetical protein